MTLNLTPRQREIILSIQARATGKDGELLHGLLDGECKFEDIEELCSIMNNEFMMEGILPSFEPNAYGVELEKLRDMINIKRIQK